MYLNGVILVSPTDLGIKRDGPMSAALRVPYMAATAWHHKKLPADLQSKDLVAYLPEVEAFTVNELLPALAQGGAMSKEKRSAMVKKLSRYTGLSETAVMNQNLEIPFDFFWKELLRDQGKTVGRLDSRYIGIDKKDAGERPDYNSELTSWEHSFTPAINMYLRDELGYKTDLNYYIFGPVQPWDNSNNNTGDDLRLAMMENPYLNLLVQSGYYDGACDYFNAKYNMWQMDPAGKIQDRMFWEGYRSGHMMYLRKEDLSTSNDHLRVFIKNSIPKPGVPAKF
jgi:carboxypeptidase C (cathepsin A)